MENLLTTLAPKSTKSNIVVTTVKSGNRKIEVKGVGESWKNHTWQRLHETEVQCLRGSPNDFYLYLVKFKDTKSDEVVGFYVIPGVDLLNEKIFRIKVEDYGLRPISQRKLSQYSIAHCG